MGESGRIIALDLCIYIFTSICNCYLFFAQFFLFYSAVKKKKKERKEGWLSYLKLYPHVVAFWHGISIEFCLLSFKNQWKNSKSLGLQTIVALVYNYVSILFYVNLFVVLRINHTSGIMVSVLGRGVVDHGFEPSRVNPKTRKRGICWLSTKQQH